MGALFRSRLARNRAGRNSRVSLDALCDERGDIIYSYGDVCGSMLIAHFRNVRRHHRTLKICPVVEFRLILRIWNQYNFK